MKKIYIVEFELEIVDESPIKAYVSALDKLEDLIRKQRALGVPKLFDEVPNGGIDGAAPTASESGWKCVFAIKEKVE